MPIQSGQWIEDYPLTLLFNHGNKGIANLQDLPRSESVNVAPALHKKFQEWGYL